jgi:hypothetical protein
LKALKALHTLRAFGSGWTDRTSRSGRSFFDDRLCILAKSAEFGPGLGVDAGCRHLLSEGVRRSLRLIGFLGLLFVVAQ